MSNHGHRGVLSFRIQISPLCSECPVPCPPPSELSSHALCVSSRSSPFAVSHHQHHRHHPHHHHHHHHSTCDSDFSTSICHVTLTFASKRVKQRNVGASPCFGWTEIFPSFCQSGDLLAHDVHIDKPKAWCQQKRARSHVGFRTEWSPAPPVTQLPFVSPLLKYCSINSYAIIICTIYVCVHIYIITAKKYDGFEGKDTFQITLVVSRFMFPNI